MSTEREGTGTGTKELEHVQCIRFNSHLNIALPDLAEASASHQSIIPLTTTARTVACLEPSYNSQIPSTILCKEAGLSSPIN